MSEIKEFIKSERTDNKAELQTSKLSLQSPTISLLIFAAIFLVDLFLIHKFTGTTIVFTCILLVLQVVIAVALDQLNYAALLGVAILELIFGLLLHNLLLVFLTLFVYFAALYVIHSLRTAGGYKKA